MKIELKSLKIHDDISEDSLCFSANMYLDGKKRGKVSNDGRGGPHRFHFDDRETGIAFDLWAKDQPLPFNFEKGDQIVDQLIAKKEQEAMCRARITFRLTGDPEGQWRQIGWKGVRKLTLERLDKARTQLVAKYGEQLEEILNDTLAEAS